MGMCCPTAGVGPQPPQACWVGPSLEPLLALSLPLLLAHWGRVGVHGHFNCVLGTWSCVGTKPISLGPQMLTALLWTSVLEELEL